MTDTIFFLEKTISKNEIDNLTENYQTLKIISLDYDSHKFLEDSKIKHIVGDSVLTDEVLTKIDNMAINITNNWYKNNFIQKNFSLNDIILPSLLSQEFLIFFKHIYINLFTILEIIDRLNPKEVFCSTSLNDFILKICEQKNIKINSLDTDISSELFHENINLKFNLLNIPFSFQINRKNYQKILKVKKSVDCLLNLGSKNLDKSKKSILLLNFDISNYEEFLIQLSKLKVNILLLNLRKPATSNLNEINIVKKTHCTIINLDEYKKKISSKSYDEKIKLKENLKKLFDDDKYFYDLFSINDISFWPSIKNSFKKICNSRLNESMERILLLDEFFNQNKISSILEWAEVGQEEQECLYVSKKFKIPSVMLQHGKYLISKKWDPFAKFLAQFPSEFLSDKQAVWGKFTNNFAIEHGQKQDDLIISGSPKHDKFFNFEKNNQTSNKILLATTGPFDTSADTSTIHARINYENLVKEVCTVMSKIPEKKLIIKPHPSAKYTQDTLDLLKDLDTPFDIVVEGNLLDLISQSDLVITFNNSTIALESVILGVPVISIQTGAWAEEDEIVKFGAIKSVIEIEKIEEEIKNVLFDSSTRKTLYENGLKFLNEYMSFPGESSKKLAQIMNGF